MRYIPTKLTPLALDTLLELGSLPTAVYLVLCKLGAHRPEGCTASTRLIGRELEGRSRATHVNRGRIAEAVTSLRRVGLLVMEADEMHRMMRYQLISQGGDKSSPVTNRNHPPGDKSSPPPVTNSNRSGDKSSPPTNRREEGGRKNDDDLEDARCRASNIVNVDFVTSSSIAVEAPSASPSSSSISIDELQRLIASHEQLRGRVSRRKLEQLGDEVGAAEVAQQLDWFRYRDTSWARSPAGAFVRYCTSKEPEPEQLAQVRRARQRAEERPERVDGVSLREYLAAHPAESGAPGLPYLRAMMKGDE